MPRLSDILLTALAPIIWGSSYIITTEMLPGQSPFLIALLRALPAGLLLMLFARQLPVGRWWGRVAVLGILNFSLFWSLLFVAAYRLPGGVAAMLGAVQPLAVIFLARGLLGQAIRPLAVFAALAGLFGVGLLLFRPEASLDPLGIAAGLLGAASMAAGVVLTRKWQPDVPLLTFTAWQLTAGGLFLIPVAVLMVPDWPTLSVTNLAGLAYLSLIGGALTYFLWFRGIARIDPAAVSSLGFLSPLAAILLGWFLLGETLTALQIAGAVVILISVRLGQSGGFPLPHLIRTKPASLR